MGCTSSIRQEMQQSGTYPGEGYTERKAKLDWEGGGWSYTQNRGSGSDSKIRIARRADDKVLRVIREEEWGEAVCSAYYEYLYDTQGSDDWGVHPLLEPEDSQPLIGARGQQSSTTAGAIMHPLKSLSLNRSMSMNKDKLEDGKRSVHDHRSE